MSMMAPPRVVHRRTEFVGNDEAREVIHHRRQVVPAPADDTQVREVGLRVFSNLADAEAWLLSLDNELFASAKAG
jgi:hypothetical protein